MSKSILLPVVASQSPMAAVDSAVAMARAFHAEICIVSVVDPFPFTSVGPDLALGRAHYLAAARQVASDAINKAFQMVRAQGIEARTALIEEHLVWKGILDLAAEVKADVVVMGSRGQHGLYGRVLGGVTYQVLQHSHIPVLVVNDIEPPVPPRAKAWDIWRSVRTKGKHLAQNQRQR